MDVTELEAFRDALNQEYSATRGKLTLLPFLIRAMVLAVREFPEINARYDDDAGVIVGNPLDCGRDDEVGKNCDGHEGTHGQQVEVEEQPRQAIAPAPGRGFVIPEDRQELVIASHAC